MCSMISEQVKQLKEEAKYLEKDQEKRLASILYQAADTIEALFTKLQEDNNDEWIIDRVPTKEECGNYNSEEFLVTVDAGGIKVLCMEYEYTTVRKKEVSRWVWNDRVNIPWDIIAWRKFPKPYLP